MSVALDSKPVTQVEKPINPISQSDCKSIPAPAGWKIYSSQAYGIEFVYDSTTIAIGPSEGALYAGVTESSNGPNGGVHIYVARLNYSGEPKDFLAETLRAQRLSDNDMYQQTIGCNNFYVTDDWHSKDTVYWHDDRTIMYFLFAKNSVFTFVISYVNTPGKKFDLEKDSAFKYFKNILSTVKLSVPNFSKSETEDTNSRICKLKPFSCGVYSFTPTKCNIKDYETLYAVQPNCTDVPSVYYNEKFEEVASCGGMPLPNGGTYKSSNLCDEIPRQCATGPTPTVCSNF